MANNGNNGNAINVDVLVVGAGPAGLMAAQTACDAGYSVHVCDTMPSVGRKFLLAGKGGLNLTHSEGFDAFVERYGPRRAIMADLLQDFDANAVREWAHGLGVETFVGSSGRVFPKDMKAAPLLRNWLQRLRHPPGGSGGAIQSDAPVVGAGPCACPDPRAATGGRPYTHHIKSHLGVGVQFHMRHRWNSWGDAGDTGIPSLHFETPHGAVQIQARAVVLALGGGSWARLGSDGAWVPLLAQKGVALAPLLPANCGFDVTHGWSDFFANKFAGQPFKSVAIAFTSSTGQTFRRKGEFVATASGVEGSLVYAASSLLRDDIARTGSATFHLDLLPDMEAQRVLDAVSHPRGSRSLSSHLKSRLHLDGIKMALLHELLPKQVLHNPAQLAAAIKAVPILLCAPRPLDEAISTAGGVCFEDLTPSLMLRQLPGVFCAGEMLDWEAPTGGYLLTACLSTGRRAGQGVLDYLKVR